jgi:hypothetical protein
MAICSVDMYVSTFLVKGLYLHFKHSLGKFDKVCSERTSLFVTSHELAHKNKFNLLTSLENLNSKINFFYIKTVEPLLIVSLGRCGLFP